MAHGRRDTIAECSAVFVAGQTSGIAALIDHVWNCRWGAIECTPLSSSSAKLGNCPRALNVVDNCWQTLAELFKRSVVEFGVWPKPSLAQ